MTFKPLTVPTKTLLVSITASATTFRVNNIKGWDGINLQASDFGTQAFCVFRNATRTRMEIMEFDPSTIASTSITIVRRGLDFDGDLTTEISANKFAWTKGDTYVDLGTDAPQVWQWIKEYADNAIVGGASDADTSVKGLSEISTTAEINSGALTGGTGANLTMNPSYFKASNFGRKATSIQIIPGSTAVTVGDGKAYITVPEAMDGMNLVRAQAVVVTAGTTGATTVMVHNKTQAADMLSVAVSIASGGTVGTVGTVDTGNDDVATNDILRIDVDSVSNTAPQGLIVMLEFALP